MLLSAAGDPAGVAVGVATCVPASAPGVCVLEAAVDPSGLAAPASAPCSPEAANPEDAEGNPAGDPNKESSSFLVSSVSPFAWF